MDPKRDIPKATIWGLHTLVITAFLTLFLNTGVVGVEPPLGSRARRCSTASRRSSASGTAAELLGADRRDRPGGELLHDHLRVRPEHVLAVARGLLPEVAVEDARHPEDAVRRADRGRGRRLRASRTSSTGSASAKATWRRKVVAALLNMAVFAAVISYTMQCLSFVLLRRKIPNMSGRIGARGECGRRRRRRHRRDLADRALPGRGLPARRVRRRRSTSSSASCTSRSPAGTGWCCRLRRSSRSRWASRVPEQRDTHLEGGAGGDPEGGSEARGAAVGTIGDSSHRLGASRQLGTLSAAGDTPAALSVDRREEGACSRGCSTSRSWRSSPPPVRSTRSCACSRTCRAGSWASVWFPTSSWKRCWARKGCTPASTCSRSTWRWSRSPATSTRAGRPATATSGWCPTCPRCAGARGSRRPPWSSATSPTRTRVSRWRSRPGRS